MATNSSENLADIKRRNARPWKNIRHELMGFSVAEIASEGTWLGVAALTTAVPDRFMDGATKIIAHSVVEPVLDPLEKIIDKICRLEECKIDPTLTREQRAEHLARAIVVFTPALAASWAVKMYVRHWLQPGKKREEDKLFSPQAKMIIVADELTQLGSMYVLNNQLAPVSDSMIRGVTGMSQKILGVSEKRAHEFASTVVIWAVPNAIGMLGASVAIVGKHLRDWPKGWIGKVLGRDSSHSPISHS